MVHAKRAMGAVVALLAAFMIAVLFAPAQASADDLAAGQAKDKYHQLTGTVYFSRSHDAKFCVSDGNDPGVVMANAPIDLAEVCKVDLDDYGLGDYKLAAPEGAGYEYECTMMQLFVYAAQRFSAAGADMEVTGEAASAFIKRYWGADENFLYYVNGAYPMDASLGEGMGATADRLRLKDGDVLSVAHYANWSFYTDELAGFHFFLGADGQATHTYVARTGDDVPLRLARASGDADAGSPTAYTPEAGWDVWWGPDYDDSPGNELATGHAKTDAAGAVTLSFDTPGTYWVWADGGRGKTVNAVVSSPAAARVVVADDPAPQVAVPRAAEGLVYDGAEQVGVAAGEGVALSGVTSAVDAGSYMAYAVPAEGFTWPDGTRHVKEVAWTIARRPITCAEVMLDVSGPVPCATVTLDGAALAAPDDAVGAAGDYTATFSISCDAGAGVATARADVKGSGNYSGSVSASAQLSACPLSMKLSPARAAFTGSRITPSVEVSSASGAFAAGDFELRYVNVATGVSSRVAPTAAGVYRVVALLSDDAAVRLGYALAEVFAPFEIYDPDADSGDSGGDGGQGGSSEGGEGGSEGGGQGGSSGGEGGQGDAPGGDSGSGGSGQGGSPAAAKTAISKASVAVGRLTYTGKALSPKVTVKHAGKALKAGTDYSLGFLNAKKKAVKASAVKAAGTYYANVTGKGAFTGTKTVAFTVARAPQAITAKAKVAKALKANKKTRKLAKSQTVALKALAKVKAKTAVRFAKANKAGGSKIAIASKTGKVTLKKGLPRGAYKVKVKLTAAANANYKAAKAKTITLTVKVT